jgi:FAD/FMN-containing dehydrogenase
VDFYRHLQQVCPGLELSIDPAVLQSHGRDWTRFRPAAPAAVAFPKSTEQVCRLVAVAAEAGIPLVPSGGRTGLSGGAVAANGEVVVSFDRMRRVLEFSPTDRSLTVEAGVATARVQELARENGLYYPVSFASEGSSQVGGNIATNAGGIRVLRHGTTRDRVTGLRVVTGEGRELELNRGLVKNASGYDLRHLFIGSEGTLGLIVEATLQLESEPPPSRVMLLGMPGMDALMNVFELLRSSLRLSAFEFFTDRALAHVCDAHGLAQPLTSGCPVYVVTEFDCSGPPQEERALEAFDRGLAEGWLADGVISTDSRQAAALWRYREGISESISHFPPYKNDLSVRISKVAEFLRRMDGLVGELCPGYEVVWYGHIGDGNLHLNILKPPAEDIAEFEARSHDISEASYALTAELGGSISAEHGIGLLKQPWLNRVRSADEIELMKGLKKVFDPAGIFNPGKLLQGP